MREEFHLEFEFLQLVPVHYCAVAVHCGSLITQPLYTFFVDYVYNMVNTQHSLKMTTNKIFSTKMR